MIVTLRKVEIKFAHGNFHRHFHIQKILLLEDESEDQRMQPNFLRSAGLNIEWQKLMVADV